MKITGEESDEELMNAYAVSGDSHAFVFLYKRYEQRLFGYLARRLFSGHQAQAGDLFQRTWLKVHESRNKFDPTLRFSAWIFTIAQNLLRDYISSGHVRLSRQLDDQETVGSENVADDIEAGYFRKLEWSRVCSALAEVSDLQREAFLLSAWEGFTSKEIAQLLKVSEANARQLVSRAKSALKNLLEEARS